MPPLRSLRVTNFKSLRSVDLNLGPLNVLVGPNGSGKSNLLDVIQFLGDSVRQDLEPALRQRGGYDEVRFHGRTTESGIRIRVTAAVTRYASSGAPDEYELIIGTRKLGDRRVLTRRESFQFKRVHGRGRRITIRGTLATLVDEIAGAEVSSHKTNLRSDSLGLSTLPRLTPEEGGDQVGQLAALFATFRVFDVDVQAARRPSALENSGALAHDASNLAGFLNMLAEEHNDAFVSLLEDARAFVPGLNGIEFRLVGGSVEAVATHLVEAGLSTPTPLSHASYGSVRALALLALIYDPDPPLLTCIEEVDHGLHPYVFDRLVERLRWASQRTQILVATHSPALVNRLRPDELIVCERDLEGASRIPALDAETVSKMEEAAGDEVLLGELWFAGSLGGVPQE